MKSKIVLNELGLFLAFLSILVISMGSEGPDVVDCLEASEMFQKVLQYLREPKLAILE